MNVDILILIDSEKVFAQLQFIAVLCFDSLYRELSFGFLKSVLIVALSEHIWPLTKPKTPLVTLIF